MGMGLAQALKMMLMLWVFSLLGVVMGVLLGSIPTASPWIYSFTAGVFIYLALVDLVSVPDKSCLHCTHLVLCINLMLSFVLCIQQSH